MFVSNPLPKPALLKAKKPAPLWTAFQLLQTCLPSAFDCYGPNEVLSFFSSVQPMLMEKKGYSEGFSVGLKDFFIAKELQENIQMSIQDVFPPPASLKSSSMSDLIDSKSVSAINRVFQQIGFLSVQMSDKGKLYSSSTYRTVEFSFVRSCLFHGLDPYQEMVHSINSREVMATYDIPTSPKIIWGDVGEGNLGSQSTLIHLMFDIVGKGKRTEFPKNRTMMLQSRMEWLRIRLEFPNCYVVAQCGLKGGLAVLWDDSIQLKVSMTRSWMTLQRVFIGVPFMIELQETVLDPNFGAMGSWITWFNRHAGAAGEVILERLD
ncbi:hypothetical protein LguiB_020522 [Lonicera macranthoides]